MFRSEKISFGPVELHLLYYKDFDVNEYSHNLLPEEKKRLIGFSHPDKRREYVATRVLRSMVFGNTSILYSSIGAPYIEEEGFVSISHAHKVIGLAFCKTFPIGLDLEQVRPKVLKVVSKFLSESEMNLLNTNDVVEMTKAWSAKEALYKLAGKKGIHLSRELSLFKKSDERWQGEIFYTNKKRKAELTVIIKNDFIISLNASPVIDEKI
ncbi:MAG: 4'-phosphopantetheinyl transferase superfamily protein [Brumimicrobium sp.]|nr:4'-phosphopantetheinyl transferase superfamily protein [Brumimicrobium sp.]